MTTLAKAFALRAAYDIELQFSDVFKTRYDQVDPNEFDYDGWKKVKFRMHDALAKANDLAWEAKHEIDMARIKLRAEIGDIKANQMWFRTNYKEANTGQNYANGLYAFDESHAKELILKRGLDEELVTSSFFGMRNERDWMLPSVALEKWWVEYWTNPKFCNDYGSFDKTMLTTEQQRDMANLQEKVIHGATFVGFLALKSGVATVDEVLSDCGITHHAVHLCSGTFGVDESELMYGEYRHALPMMREIESRVPGLTK